MQRRDQLQAGGALLCAHDGEGGDEHRQHAGLLSWRSLAELDYWRLRRLTADAWLTFLDDVLAGALSCGGTHRRRFAPLPGAPGTVPRLAWRVVDASVMALAERLGEPKVATLDHRHFRAVRPAHVEALRLLP